MTKTATFTEEELDYLRSQRLARIATADRNIRANPRVAIVIDDLASITPWKLRGIEVTRDGGASGWRRWPRGVRSGCGSHPSESELTNS